MFNTKQFNTTQLNTLSLNVLASIVKARGRPIVLSNKMGGAFLSQKRNAVVLKQRKTITALGGK